MSKLSQSDGYTMTVIPAGLVELRDDRVKKTWNVQVDRFLMANVPVTNELYDSIMGQSEGETLEPNTPVVHVSWLGAISFCNELSRRSGFQPCYSLGDGETVDCDFDANGYRLPTEAEWQYACKAGSRGYRYGELDEIAWYRSNAGGSIQAIGKKLPNAWGLYDMIGNVWEWCWDLYDTEVYGSYRLFRGGSWAEEARGCGATCRRRSHPTFSIDDLGFRLARSVPDIGES